MNDLRAMLGAADHLWSVGTGAGVMAFVPDGTVAEAEGSLIAGGGQARLRLNAGARLLAFETISSDPRGWNHGIAVCAADDAPPMPPASQPWEPDAMAIRPQDRGRIAFDLGGDSIARLRFRPDDDAVAAARSLIASGGAGVWAPLAELPGIWVVQTRIAQAEQWKAGGNPPVHRPGGGPSRATPLPAGWLAAAHVFPPHPARIRPGQPAAFDPVRHAAFQGRLAQFGRRDLWDLKQRVLDSLAAGRFETIETDRHAATIIRVTLRQQLAAGMCPSDQWLARYDPALFRALDGAE